ncbi:DeoR/GlpR family DNA-binding transcription regulator [Georgenia sp. TF02-10]|uniref:DeoR/GlpR family DNA-binding transcription regulator n=1 Tax=Georgenia sp. TF02-10 TaxID=2917725 RepID=UPI001FA81078|nr:DeoR/GlpR family DNA-binding transcription regulator [Georgenia sp. TF02-10]UNX53850.1 DeoR/GlpR family DNA-binding transcription regulator [Georgenia sp. TF02-10]
MYAEERQHLITSTAHGEGRVSVTRLAERFGVTAETIRRDLELLDRRGVLRRVHGGAVPVDKVRLSEPALPQRAVTHVAEKKRIARAALAHLPTGPGSIVLDAGTTTGHLAQLLPDDPDLVTITNSLPAAAALTGRASGVFLLGGRVRGLTQAAVGTDAERALARTRVDVAFLGTNGLTPAHGASTPDPAEAAVKRAMVQAARRVVVLADAAKIGQEHLVSFASLEEIDVLVTDASISIEDRQALEARNLEVVVA